MSLKQT